MELRPQDGLKYKDPLIQMKGSVSTGKALSDLSVLIALIIVIFARCTALFWIALEFFPTSRRASFLFVAL